MTNELFDGLTVLNFRDDIYRNIVSLRESQDLFDDLTDLEDGRQAAINLEVASGPFIYSITQPIIERPFEEATYNEAVRFPFQNWSKTRYSDGSFGVWYGAASLETSIYETVYHWQQFLDDAGWASLDGVAIGRKVYCVICEAVLLDFRSKIDRFPGLVDKNSYHYTQQIGARIHHEGQPGVVTRSARCGGETFAIFNSRVLSAPRPSCFLTYRQEERTVVVERQLGEVIAKVNKA